MQRKGKYLVYLFSLMIFSVSSEAQTNYSPLYTSANFVKTIDLSRPVGTIGAASGTTPSGGVTYSIPIYAPPGTNGMEPSISITYNSQGGPGVVGYDWSIAGLSAISRTGKNMYHNGAVKPVSYTYEDAFLLDGMRLNAIVGNNGANATEYAGETETFTKIVSTTFASANNPYMFLVTAKDGTKMEYGNTSDSKVLTEDGQNIMLWRLNRIIDINDNYIDFKYNNASRDSRIDEINYTGNITTGLLPYNKIKFTYGNRYETNTGYDGGASLSSMYLLNKITITCINDDIMEVAKSYQFNYGYDNVHSLLKEVVEYGAGINSPPALNSTIFLYGDPPQNTSTSEDLQLTGNKDIFSGDFDADGLSDIMAVNFIYVEQVKKYTDYSIYTHVDNGSNGVLLYSHTLPGNTILGGSANKLYNFLSGDYNKDGRDDVLYLAGSVVEYGQTFLIEKAVLNTTGDPNLQGQYVTHYFDYPIYQGNHYLWTNTSEKSIVQGDFDGDGNQDYILISYVRCSNNQACGYRAFFCSPATNEINLPIFDFGVGQNNNPEMYAKTVAEAKKIVPIDFDGDGKLELLVVRDEGSYVLRLDRLPPSTGILMSATVVSYTNNIFHYATVYPGDFNGDRKTDLLTHNEFNQWLTAYSDGKDFIFTPQIFTFNDPVHVTGTYNEVTDKIVVADFNGDGKSDILHGYDYFVNGLATSSKLSFYYSKGIQSTFFQFYYEQYSHNTVLSPQGIDLVVGDYNGDGRSDVACRYPSKTSFIKIKPYGKERLLMKVADGHNVTASFDYRLLTDKTTYPYIYDRTVSLDDPINQNPFNYAQIPIQVVSSMIMPDGIGGTSTTSFFYENAVVHRHAKGFLGFRRITTKNTNSVLTDIVENEINTQFAVPYTVKQKSILRQYPLPDETIFETSITNSFVNLSTGYHDIRYYQKVDKTLVIDYLNGRASESVNTYDNYGNITTNISKAGIPSGNTVNPTETTTTTTIFGMHNTPVPAMPDNINVSNTRTGMPAISVTSTFTYSANGLPATQTSFYGLPKAVTSTYAYNNFGNITQTITSASGVSNRTTTATYDLKGRYPVTKQNVGSTITQTESLTYDNKWGKLLSRTSTDCLSTTFEYDEFGRLKKTNLPAGYSVNNTLVWDVQGEQVFYSFVDFPGGKPDTKTWVDKLGRGIKSQTAGFNNQWLTQFSNYNEKGNVSSKTNAYYPGETPLLTTTTYDVYDRPVSVSNTLTTITSTYTPLGNGMLQVTTQNSAGQSASKISDAAGKTVSSIDNGGQLDFTYDSRGNLTETKHGNTVLITSSYDIYGRQTSMVDKNAGTMTYDYDAYGQLIQQTDALGNNYIMSYDDFGRIISRQGPVTEGTTTYEYYKNKFGTCSNNSLSKVTGFNGIIKQYTYDAMRRLQTEKITLDGVDYTTSYSYDTYSNITNTTYPSGVVVNNVYDANGGLSSITGGDSWNPVTLFTANAVNGFGQYTNYTLGNGKTSQNTYYFGTPTRLYTPGVQDLNLSFDFTKGNLLSRYEATKNLTETFQYDNLNRLTKTTVNGVQQLSINYDGNSSFSMGNITSKTDAGDYVYYNGANGIDKIHAVAYITNPAGPTAPPITISPTLQQLTYTPFQKTANISEAPAQSVFTYGPDYQRVKSELYFAWVGLNTTKYYTGTMERVISNGYTRDIHYIPVGNSLAIIETPLYGSSIIHFVYTDHLGSLLTRTDINGTITAEQNFDAWGRNRNPNTWQYGGTGISFQFFDRGFTGHEHLPYYALINMNGRMYDPIQGRMLSPDNYVSNPFGTQGYNRYSYANNNPLSYTDPDGDFPWLAVALVAYSAISRGIQSANNGMGFGQGFLQGVALGGGTAIIGAGISSGLSVPLQNLGMAGSGFVSGAISGSIAGAYYSMANGGNVLSGTLKGALFGGLTGAAMGAIRRLSLKNSYFESQNDGGGSPDEIFTSQSDMDNYINNNIGDVDKIEQTFSTPVSLASPTNKPPDLEYLPTSNTMYDPINETKVWGATTYKGGWISRLRSNIFISPSVKGIYENGMSWARPVINHELLHAWANTIGPRSDLNSFFSEGSASRYTLDYANFYNMPKLGIRALPYANRWFPFNYSWQFINLNGGRINWGIKY